MSAMKLCIDRLLAPVKSEPLNTDMSIETLTSKTDLSDIYKTILNKTFSGDLTPLEAQSISDILKNYQGTEELKEARIISELLEKNLEKEKKNG